MARQTEHGSARRAALLSVALLAIAAPAWANAGSALAASECCHLFFANIVIGIVEACVLLALYRVRFVKACLLMVAANYVSMFAGVALQGLGLGLLDTHLARAPLYHVGSALVALVLGSYLVTIALEWPFCRWALGWRDTSFAKAFVAAIVTSGVTYIGLALVYLPATDITLLTRAHVDRDLVSSSPDDATIYFVGEDDYLYSVRISGRDVKRVSEEAIPQDAPVGRFAARSHLVLRPGEDGVDLCVGTGYGHGSGWDGGELPVLRKHIVPVLPDQYRWRSESPEAKSKPIGTPLVHAAYWDPSARSRLVADAGPAGVALREAGLFGEGRFSLSLDTPLGPAWYARNPWVLSGDRVVYQLGEQIVLLDLTTMRIGHIVNGRDPIVVPDVIDVEGLEAAR